MKAHDRNLGSAKFSRLCLKSKRNANASQLKDSTNRSLKISKYFASPTKSKASCSAGMDAVVNSCEEQNLTEDLPSTSAESPYKSSVTDIANFNVNISMNEEKDFKTPKCLFKGNSKQFGANNKTSNNTKKKGNKLKAPPNNKKLKQMVLTKAVKDNFDNTDTNPEHFQLAIALSRSLQVNHKRETEENKDQASSTSTLYPTTQQKVATMKQVLEQFGFKPKSSSKKTDMLHQRIPTEKKKKISRYRHITPILLLRKQEDREKLISQKVASILSQNSQKHIRPASHKLVQHYEPTSRNLKEHWSDDNRIFKMSSFEPEMFKNRNIFYVKSLNIPPTEIKCGSLLRDWKKIPGREKSPLRIPVSERKTITKGDNINNTSEEGVVTESSKTTSDLVSTSTNNDSDSLAKTLKSKLQQVKSFSDRSISPELFESDDEMVVETSEKRLPQKLSVSSDDGHCSPSVLNFTPRKNNSMQKIHSSISDNMCCDENSSCELLLNEKPRKKNLTNNVNVREENKNNLDVDDTPSSSFINIYNKKSFCTSDKADFTRTKCRSPYVSDNDLLESYSETCTFESFSEENNHKTPICFDLTQSSDEDLFETDDEMATETPVKNLQELLISSDNECCSQLSNLTPQKNTSVPKIQLNLNEGACDASLTKTNKTDNASSPDVKKSELGFDDATLPSFVNKFNKKSFCLFGEEGPPQATTNSLNFFDDDLIENDKGICIFESFSKDSDHITPACFDLTQSSDEDNNKVNEENDVSVLLNLTHSSNETSDLKDTLFDKTHANINLVSQNVSPLLSDTFACTSTTHISEIMQTSMYFHEDDGKNITKANRRTGSLNVTRYIYNILNEEQVSIINSPTQTVPELQQHLEVGKSEILDLTQNSTGSSHYKLPASVVDEKNYNFVLERSKEKISEFDTNSTLSPVKPNDCIGASRFEKHDSFKSADDVDLSQTSQESICISDEELNYSSAYGTPYNKRKRNAVLKNEHYLYEFSDSKSNEENDVKDLKNSNSGGISLDCTPKTSKEYSPNECGLTGVESLDNCDTIIIDSPISAYPTLSNNSFDNNQYTLKHPKVKNVSRENTPTAVKSRKSLFDGANLLDDSFNAVLENNLHLFADKKSCEAGPLDTRKQINLENQNSKSDETNTTTPKGEMIIKTTNVTPMVNYNEMDTPKISKELQKYGLKPLKRRRGVQILKHIYESTHPVVGQNLQSCEKTESDDEDHRLIKKRKSNSKLSGTKKSQSRKPKGRKAIEHSTEEEKSGVEPRVANMNESLSMGTEEKIEIVGDLMGENQAADLIFERKQSVRIPSCRVPLHIAWHNLVCSRPELRKNILLYEPLQLEVLYKMLKEQGYKYHIEDLLTFLDKKCITVRTNQNQSRRNQQTKKSKSPNKSKRSS